MRIRFRSATSACAWSDAGRRSQASKPALETPRTRAMALTGKMAWFALMNRKIRTARRWFRARTRPPLERRCRAPRGVACSRAVAGSAPRARQRSSTAQPWQAWVLCGPPADRLERPSSGSPAQTARTHAPGQMGRGQNAPDRRSGDGTPVNTVDGFSAGQHLSRKRMGVHQTGGTSPLHQRAVHTHPTPTAIHRDADLGRPQHVGELRRRELAALIGVEDLRTAECRQRLLSVSMQNAASIVFDTRHDSTSRVAQSITATR